MDGVFDRGQRQGPHAVPQQNQFNYAFALKATLHNLYLQHGF
jgi:hypothetical protein